MVSTVDLDDELVAGADEISDVACERDLTAEGDAQLAVDESCPEEALRRRRLGAHGGGASSEKSGTLFRNVASTQESLRAPVKTGKV